jgi:hypothetical protein
MLGSAVLEVAIGVAFVFLLMSTICTAVREGIESWFKSRGAYLEYGIRELLHDRSGTGLAQNLFRHPLVYGLYLGKYEPLPEVTDTPPILAKGKGKPSYLPAKSFAMALLDIAARGPRTDVVSSDPSSPVLTVESVRENVLNLQNPAVQRVVLYALDCSKGDLDVARAHIESWFDSAMDRVSGWYKRSTQWIVLAVALSVTVLLNVDTIRIAQFLYRDDVARSALVARAEAVTADQGAEQALEELEALPLPIGWASAKLDDSGSTWLTRVLGWLLTALAATLGAPFWFDVLNKFMVIRSTVKPHEKSPEEASEDRQPRAESRREPAVPLAVTVSGNGLSHGRAAGEVAGVLPAPVVSTVRDADSDVDACDVPMEDDDTPDDQLPIAEGGVAPRRVA